MSITQYYILGCAIAFVTGLVVGVIIMLMKRAAKQIEQIHADYERKSESEEYWEEQIHDAKQRRNEFLLDAQQAELDAMKAASPSIAHCLERHPQTVSLSDAICKNLEGQR